MRSITQINEIKNKINLLKGQNISLKINKGRNKIVSLTAIIDQVYPSMFVINPTRIYLINNCSKTYNFISSFVDF